MLSATFPVAESLMERAGFKIDTQSMDWQTVIRPPREEGSPGDRLRALRQGDREAARRFCERGRPAKRKALVEALQKRVAEYPTHVHLGQFYNHGAIRNNVKGIVPAPAPVLRNITIE